MARTCEPLDDWRCFPNRLGQPVMRGNLRRSQHPPSRDLTVATRAVSLGTRGLSLTAEETLESAAAVTASELCKLPVLGYRGRRCLETDRAAGSHRFHWEAELRSVHQPQALAQRRTGLSTAGKPDKGQTAVVNSRFHCHSLPIPPTAYLNLPTHC